MSRSADTANNRVLLWLSFPTAIGQPADVSHRAAEFHYFQSDPRQRQQPSRAGGRVAPGGKLFVADTQNNRVLIWKLDSHHQWAGANIVLARPIHHGRQRRSNHHPE